MNSENNLDGKMIAVVSGKGGTGKTTCSLNIAMSLHNMDKDVLLVDGDLEDPNIGINLGVYSPDMTLNKSVQEETSPEDAIYIHDTGLVFVPASLSINYTGSDYSLLGDSMKSLEGNVIVDCGPGIDEKLISILEVADSAIVVTNPIRTSLSGTVRVTELLKEMDTEIEGVVVNNITSREVTLQEIESITGCPVLGQVPYDKNIDESITRKKPVVEHKPYSGSSHAFKEIAHKMTGKEYKKSISDRLRTFHNSLTDFLGI